MPGLPGGVASRSAAAADFLLTVAYFVMTCCMSANEGDTAVLLDLPERRGVFATDDPAADDDAIAATVELRLPHTFTIMPSSRSGFLSPSMMPTPFSGFSIIGIICSEGSGNT